MKKIFWKGFLFTFLFSVSLYGASPQDFKLEKNEERTIEVKEENTFSTAGSAGNSALNAKVFTMENNSKLSISGKVENVKNIRGLYIQGHRFGSKGSVIKKGAVLDINIETGTEKPLKKGETPVEGMYLYSSNKERGLEIEENATLNITTYANQPLNIEEPHNENHATSKDLFHQMLKKSIGLTFDANIKNFGNLNIISTGFGIKEGDKNSDKLIEFEKGSKNNIKAGLIGIYAKENSVIFKEGSYSQIIGGGYGLIAKNATFEKGSKIKAMGKYGLGNFEYKGTGDKYTFQAGSELEILANEAALYAINIKEGSTKLTAKAHNVFMQVDTRIDGNDNKLATLTLEKGSILEGNIDRSWKAKILMDKGTKIFVNDRVDTNLDLKGELFVGPREDYENIKSKSYKEEIEELDSVAGASVILMGKLKNQSLDSLNAKKPYENLPTDKYYTARFNDYEYNNKIKVNFDNSKIHLRIGGADKTGATSDKIFFSRNTAIDGKGELVFHKRNASKVTKDMVFKILEEEGTKDINGAQGYYLENLPLTIGDVLFGSLIFTKKAQKLDNSYIISLIFKGIEAENFLLAQGTTKTLNEKKEDSLEDAILSGKEVTLEENSTLNIKGDTNGIFAKNKVTVEEKGNLNIEIENEGKIGIKLGENLETFGNINIKNAETGILADNTTSVLQFENGSKTLINAKDVAINAQKGSSEFKGGSNVELTSDKYALVAKKAIFENGSTVRLNGEYGIGTVSETDNSDITFEPQSEVNINSGNSGLYNINAEGSGRLSIKAPSILKQVSTGNKSLKFENGSVLEGNIEKSWNANLILDKGSRMFVDDKIEANMDIKGDLFVGERKDYEENAGESVSLSKRSTMAIKDGYHTVYYNQDSHGQKVKMNLENAKIHLKAGGKYHSGGKNSDSIIFSKDTEIVGKGAELVIHPTNVTKIKRNMTIDLLEEEKKTGSTEYDLEKLSLNLSDVELGPLVFSRKDKKLADKYIVSLSDTGRLSKAAKESMNLGRDYYEWNTKEIEGIRNKIFQKQEGELREHFWILSSKETFTNQETDKKYRQNAMYAGYDHRFAPKFSLGFFMGQSTGGIKSTAQGLYVKKEWKDFYVGSMIKRTQMKHDSKKNNFTDISLTAGHIMNNNSKLYMKNSLSITRGYMSSQQYIEKNGMQTEREKFNYINGEFNTRVGYRFHSGSIFMEAGLGKHISGKQKVLWNGNVQEELEHNGLNKKIGIGGEWKWKNHGVDVEISRRQSRYYKSDVKVSVGYQYTF